MLGAWTLNKLAFYPGLVVTDEHLMANGGLFAAFCFRLEH